MVAPLLLAGCSRSNRPSVERVALLPFENLTGDPQFDWLKSAVSRVVGAQLNGTAHTVPLLVGTLRDATQLGATRVLHGYFDQRGGALHFEARLEDTDVHRMSAQTAAGGDILAAANAAAKVVDPDAQPFGTSNPQALEAWAKGDFEKAVHQDQDFGAAWLSWIQALSAADDTVRASQAVAQALTRPSLRYPIEHAQLEMAAANFKRDFAARSVAAAKLLRLVPNDTALMASVARSELGARRFAEAARIFKELAKLEPANAEVRNLWGYALGSAGDLVEAARIFAEYARAPGGDAANAADSLGEVLMMNGKFADAEKQFLAAYAKNPQAQGGGALAKASYAHWLGGDLAGADRVFASYVEFRAKLQDPVTAWRQATWLYSTGRKADAEKMLRAITGPTAQLAQQQLAIWAKPEVALPTDAVRLRTAMERAAPSTDGLPRVLLADVLFKSGQLAEAKALLRLWPVPESPADPLLQSFVFPKYLELREKLK